MDALLRNQDILGDGLHLGTRTFENILLLGVKLMPMAFDPCESYIDPCTQVCCAGCLGIGLFHMADHLVGLVVKATASGAEDPGFGSRLRQDFSGVESYQ